MSYHPLPVFHCSSTQQQFAQLKEEKQQLEAHVDQLRSQLSRMQMQFSALAQDLQSLQQQALKTHQTEKQAEALKYDNAVLQRQIHLMQ